MNDNPLGVQQPSVNVDTSAIEMALCQILTILLGSKIVNSLYGNIVNPFPVPVLPGIKIMSKNACRAQLVIHNFGTVPLLVQYGQSNTVYILKASTSLGDGTGATLTDATWKDDVFLVAEAGSGQAIASELLLNS